MSKYYLFDPSVVTNEKNAVLRLGAVQKSTTSAAWVDPYSRGEDSDIPDWEHQVTIMYPYVIYDENGISVDKITSAKYKMWYWSKAVKHPLSSYNWLDFIIDKDNSKNVDLGDFKNDSKGVMREPDSALCYMESNDGINWHRPDCKEFYYKKQDGSIIGTNIVFIGEHGTGVQKNTHPNASKTEPLFLFACAQTGVGISYSEDGIHWETPIKLRDAKKEKIYMPADTHNQLFWSNELSKYVVITRGFIGNVRVVMVLTSTDKLTSIRDIREIDKITDSEEALKRASELFGDPIVTLTGTLDSQPYSMPVLHLCDGNYIGVVSMLDFDENSPNFMRVYASLAYSKNGADWNYVCGDKPIIENDEQFILKRGNDYGMIYCAAPINIGDEIKIFYSATPELHYFSYDQIPSSIREVVDSEIPKAKQAEAITRTTALNVATLKADRYAGYFAEDGEIRTRQFLFDADKIMLSADVLPCGCLTAAVLDENNKIIDGFDHTDFDCIKEDITGKEMVWSTHIAALKGKHIALELKLNNATVYTIEI